MRSLALWLMLLVATSGVSAREVEVTGYGETVELALRNAKTLAIEQVAGTFVTGESSVQEGRYHERIDQFHGGLIRNYQVVQMGKEEGLVTVTILADVDTSKVNTVVQSNAATISGQLEAALASSADEHKRTQEIVTALDDPRQALVIEITGIRFHNRGRHTDIEIDSRVRFNPKWYDDVRTMARTIGRKQDLGSPWADLLWGLGALSVVISPALPGTINHLARATEKPVRSSNEYAACFGHTPGWDIEECYEIRHPLQRLTRSQSLQFQLTFSGPGGDRIVAAYPVRLQNALFAETGKGGKFYFRSSAKERRFASASVLLYAQSMMPFRYTLTLPTDALSASSFFKWSIAGV